MSVNPPAAAWRALLQACLLACLVWAGAAQAATPVQVLRVHDAIGPASADYVVRGIERAAEAGAPLVVIELDTPGGLDPAMRSIIQAVLASRVPVAVYVSPTGARAASAGTYIAYAAHLSAMAPATSIGAATPVAIGMPGTGRPPAEPASAPTGDAMTAKQVNDAAAYLRGLAQLRGRNAEWAERAVRESVSLTAEEALRERVIDIVAPDIASLLRQADGRVVRLPAGEVKLATAGAAHELKLPDTRHRLLSVIANPSFALILMMIGIYGLMFEFSSPGFGVAGITGAICLLLALFALQMLPVNWAGLALLVLGLALMAAEVLTPGFGLFAAGGAAAFVVGGLLLFDREVPGAAVPLTLLLVLAGGSVAAVLLGGGMALRGRRKPVVSGAEEMVGAPGVIAEVTDQETWVMVHGERWRALGPGPLRTGLPVRVRAVHGLTLEVAPDLPPAVQPPGEPA